MKLHFVTWTKKMIIKPTVTERNKHWDHYSPSEGHEHWTHPNCHKQKESLEWRRSQVHCGVFFMACWRWARSFFWLSLNVNNFLCPRQNSREHVGERGKRRLHHDLGAHGGLSNNEQVKDTIEVHYGNCGMCWRSLELYFNPSLSTCHSQVLQLYVNAILDNIYIVG